MFHCLLALLGGLGQSGVHDVEAFPGFELQGVAWTEGTPEILQAAVRARGVFPTDGTWCLKILNVNEMDGRAYAPHDFMRRELDVTTSDNGITVSAVQGPPKPIPAEVQIDGELVHYRDVVEHADFPEVHLVRVSPQPPARASHPAFRVWTVAEGKMPTARTPLGLELRMAKLGAWGFSGVGYDDLAMVPFEVNSRTLTAGIEAQVRQCGATTVDRVDLAESPNQPLQQAFEAAPFRASACFSARDARFSPDIQLSLRVIRRIVDRSYPFHLVTPVQHHKDMYEIQRATPNLSHLLAWPSSGKKDGP